MAITLNIIKDQSLSDQVNAWLANNKATHFKMGEVHEVRLIRTGSSKHTVQENVATEKEREAKKIEAQEKARLKKQQATDAYKIVLEQRLANQKQLVADFRNKAIKGDYKRFCAEFHYTRSVFDSVLATPIRNDQYYQRFCDSIKQFSFGQPKQKVKRERKPKEKSRWQKAVEAKREAIERGDSFFEAECRNHGFTKFILTSTSSRCSLCKKEATKKRDDKKRTPEARERFNRSLLNQSLMMEALKAESRRFIGNCAKHGENEFLITKKRQRSELDKGFQYKCCECYKINKMKRKHDVLINLNK